MFECLSQPSDTSSDEQLPTIRYNNEAEIMKVEHENDQQQQWTTVKHSKRWNKGNNGQQSSLSKSSNAEEVGKAEAQTNKLDQLEQVLCRMIAHSWRVLE